MNERQVMKNLIVVCATLITLTCVHTACCAAQQEPQFELRNATVLAGDPVDLKLIGLEPGASTSITAERKFYGRLCRTMAEFKADDEGVVDLAVAEPVNAPWTGCDPRGLFWSLKDTGEDAPEEWSWRDVHFSADCDDDGVTDARATVTLQNGRDDLVETTLGDDFPGAFLLRPPGDDQLPAIIVLGGSEGGDFAARLIAPKLASRGYAVVGLPYFSPTYWGQQPQFPELPRAFHNIPVDQLEQVHDWLCEREDVNGHKIGLYGVSKGAEFVLLGSSLIDGFGAVVTYVPSDVVWEAWGPGTTEGESSCFSWRGKPLPFVPYVGMSEEIAKYSTGEKVRMRTPHDKGREANPDRIEAARIRVEDIEAPVFIVAGDEDDVWDSGGMARNIREMRDAAGLQTIAIIDEAAGHGLSGDGYAPTSEANARVQGQAFPAMLRFFETHLK